MVGTALMDAEALEAMLQALRSAGRKAVILSIEYSLAPEFPYPRALKEVLAAYDHLINVLHVPPARIAMCAYPVPSAPRASRPPENAHAWDAAVARVQVARAPAAAS